MNGLPWFSIAFIEHWKGKQSTLGWKKVTANGEFMQSWCIADKISCKIVQVKAKQKQQV